MYLLRILNLDNLFQIYINIVHIPKFIIRICIIINTIKQSKQKFESKIKQFLVICEASIISLYPVKLFHMQPKLHLSPFRLILLIYNIANLK